MAKLKELIEQIRKVLANVFQANRYDRLLQDLQDLAISHPKDMRIKIKVAETYFRSKQIDKAVETYEFVAQNYLKQNFTLKAINIYKNILKIKPSMVETNFTLAELFLKLDMKVEAINQYKIAIKIFDAEKNKEKLIDTYQKLLQLDSSTTIRRKLAETYQAYGLQKEALDQFEILGQIFRTQKQYDDLMHIYELLLSHNPENKSMMKDLCVLYLRKQDADGAIRMMERNKVESEEAFAPLYEKARAMKKLLKSPKHPGATPPASPQQA